MITGSIVVRQTNEEAGVYWAPSDGKQTPARTREFARALMEAADRADEMNGGRS